MHETAQLPVQLMLHAPTLVHEATPWSPSVAVQLLTLEQS